MCSCGSRRADLELHTDSAFQMLEWLPPPLVVPRARCTRSTVHFFANVDKAKRELGWKPKHTFLVSQRLRGKPACNGRDAREFGTLGRVARERGARRSAVTHTVPSPPTA